ncbi:MAG: hypothetical protein ACI8PZ_003170 [Myxococcota bacterium]
MSLADQALANLVDQFARPLDFLRELAQNAIDAGSPRIEVTVAFEAGEEGEGVLTVAVHDFGEGMDEGIIDGQLTRLFASTKEDDLTKIGKFGIGFTSVFAIRPEAVLVRTGRHGEYWELVFHADRTFDKVRLEEPVAGTRITLFKRMPESQARSFAEECRATLTFWCEHSDTPILFTDATSGEVSAPAPVDEDDPFAAFADAALAEVAQINRPMELDAPLRVRTEVGGIVAVLGAGATPRFGFYSGGLTLLSTTSDDALGKHSDDLRHLTFKLKSDRLEHTLTRDNVIQDEEWERAMEVLQQARGELRQALLDRLEEAVARDDGPAIDQWHGVLAAELATHDGAAWFRGQLGRPLLADVTGAPLTLKALRKAPTPDVLLAEQIDPLVGAVLALEIPVVRDRAAVRRVLGSVPMRARLGSRALRPVGDVFVLPQLVADTDLDPLERDLLDGVRQLLRAAVGVHLQVRERRWSWEPDVDGWANRLDLHVGDFGGLDRGSREVLALHGPRSGKVFLRPRRTRRWLPAFLSWRTLLLNRRHPLYRSWVLAGSDEPLVAALGLAQALLHTEDIEGDAAYRRMLHRAAEQLT